MDIRIKIPYNTENLKNLIGAEMGKIKINGGTILLEISNRCYTGCKYCYKKIGVHSKGLHLDLQTLKERVDWIKDFTDATTIYLLGGEPLLSPYFIEISEYILSQNFQISIITSGVVSKIPYEIANYQYMLEQYKNGNMYIELSYHVGRNEDQFEEIVKFIKKNYKNRRKNLKKMNRLNRSLLDFHSTLVVSKDTQSHSELAKQVENVFKVFGWVSKTIEEELKSSFENHFVLKTETMNSRATVEPNFRGFRASLNLTGEREVQVKDGKVSIQLPPGQVCPSISVEIEDSTITTDSLVIRFDGGVIFSVSQCIDMSGPLLNVSIHTDQNSIFDAFTGSISQMKAHVYKFNRLKAKENCGPEGQELACTACPFDKMCTPCWHTKRPWQNN